MQQAIDIQQDKFLEWIPHKLSSCHRLLGLFIYTSTFVPGISDGTDCLNIKKTIANFFVDYLVLFFGSQKRGKTGKNIIQQCIWKSWMLGSKRHFPQ